MSIETRVTARDPRTALVREKYFSLRPKPLEHWLWQQSLPQAEDLTEALTRAGNPPATYVKPTAGHSALEIENCRALTEIMDKLPKMPAFEKKAAPAPKHKGMGR